MADATKAESKNAEPISTSSPAAAASAEVEKPSTSGTDGDAKVDEEKGESKPTEDSTSTKEATPTDPIDKAAKEEEKSNEAADAKADDAADAKTAVPDNQTSKDKSRRKSGATDSKAKTLNKKGSKARLTHIDAQPGDHFLVKLKGFPNWPAIICDEDMLPEALLKSRPVTAAKPDGSYNPNYADGGKRVNDRTFPLMYLYTNEFGWVVNTALTELTADMAQECVAKTGRRDLKSAYELAAEDNTVEHYKDMLQQIIEEMAAAEEAKKEAAATPKKSKKAKAKTTDEDEDVEMADASEAPKSSKSKKRKAEEDTSTPQRSDSVKKPKIKLNTSSTPKAANGTPKAKEESAAKASVKAKAKKGSEKKSDAAKDAKATPEERRARKEKEVLYLRHKLQRGLLTRDQQPQESEMKSMSDYVGMLENFAELEVSIIRTTKINKVLKAILKLDSIPLEPEFEFKKRSQSLLDKWNKLMASDGPATANGVNGASDGQTDEKKDAPNGVQDEEQQDAKKDGDETTKDKDTSEEADSKIDTTEKEDDEKVSSKEAEIITTETPAATSVEA